MGVDAPKGAMTGEVAAGRTRLILDLADVRYIDSTGRGTLIGGLKRAGDADESMVLLWPSPRLRRMLSNTGLDRLFEIADPEADAIDRAERTPELPLLGG